MKDRHNPCFIGKKTLPIRREPSQGMTYHNLAWVYPKNATAEPAKNVPSWIGRLEDDGR